MHPSQIGRYQVVEELGRGAMGRVLRAEDPTIGRQVAIKVIGLAAGSPEEQSQFERAFVREIRAAGALHHPGIVSIFDAGRQDDFAYIVMELVEGANFDAMLNADPRPGIPALLAICREAAQALDYAHNRGVVHRDIKPANILVSHGGTARVADFGIAKTTSHGATISAGRTMIGAGTPSFMSPEQIQGLQLDGRTDQWSLAVIAYIAVTGSKPFPAEQMAVILGQIVTIDPQPPSRLNPALAPAVDAVLARALAKDRDARYPTCTEFIRDLELACDTPAAQAIFPPPPTPGSEPDIEPAAAQPAKIQPRKTLIAAAGLLLVLAVLVGILTHRHPAAPPSVTHNSQPATRPATSEPPSTHQPQAQPAVARAKAVPAPKKTWQVRLITTPTEADLTIDGKADSACKSPCAIELAEGQHSVLIKKDGFHMLFRNIEVSPADAEIAFTLQQLTGSLLIDTQPRGASIAVNGSRRAETTPATLVLPPGTYKVRVSMDGFDPYDFDTVVPADATREVSVTLAKSASE